MNETPDSRLDRLAKMVARDGGISDDDAARIGSSPFLYARVRARIEADRNQRAELGSGWLATLIIASRAITVLLLVTIGAAATFWISRATSTVRVSTTGRPGDNISRIAAGGTCALSTTEECAISNDEALATLFAEEGREQR